MIQCVQKKEKKKKKQGISAYTLYFPSLIVNLEAIFFGDKFRIFIVTMGAYTGFDIKYFKYMSSAQLRMSTTDGQN